MMKCISQRFAQSTHASIGILQVVCIFLVLQPSFAQMEMGYFKVPEDQAVLVPPPHVPPPIGRRVPTTIHVRLEARETILEIAPGVSYPCTTINGSVPGPLIRVFEGDTVSLEFANHPDNMHTYSLDFHAASGPGGGASVSETSPGQKKTIVFKAEHRGLFMYHAGGPDEITHTANGMFGMMLVQPTYGFRRASREYYLVQSEFYTSGEPDTNGMNLFSLDAAQASAPTYVVFNGAVDSLTGDRALGAATGERVRLFVGNAGPNLSSSFHVVGKVQDYLLYEGGTTVNTSVDTTRIPAGGTTIVELDMDTAGDFEIIDHAMSRASFKGARATLHVTGENVPGGGIALTANETYQPSAESKPQGTVVVEAEPSTGPEPQGTRAAEADMEAQPLDELASASASPSLEEKVAAGKEVYDRTCIACHQATGQGLASVYPPLAQSDYLLADIDRAIHGVIKGQMGEMIVNGKKYNMLMPPQMLSDEEIAAVLTYVLNSWGNPGGEVTSNQVSKVRAQD